MSSKEHKMKNPINKKTKSSKSEKIQLRDIREEKNMTPIVIQVEN